MRTALDTKSAPLPAIVTSTDHVADALWQLPGLRVAVDSDAKSFSVDKAEGATDLIYTRE